MRIAIYARVSTDRQAEQGASIEDQISLMQQWALENGHQVISIFKEPGASAYDDRRPVFQHMIELATSPDHPFEMIVVHSQSRFYRDNVLRELVKRKLNKYEVKVCSITQPAPENDSSAYLLENVIGLIDEFQSRENSKHVIRCQRRNAEKGFYNGCRPPYGYQIFATDIPARNGVKKRLIIEPNEAGVVKEIFRLADEGLNGMTFGTKRIAEWLTNSGYLNRGKPWIKQQIHFMLTNRVYMGEHVTFKRESKTRKIRPESEWVTVPVPPIVTKDQFVSVQKALASRQIDKTEMKAEQVETLLTGLLRCSICQKNLVLMTGKSGLYKYYRCSTKNNTSVTACSCPNLPKEELEQAIIEALANKVLVPERISQMMTELQDHMAKTSGPEKIRLKALQRDAAMQTEKISLLYEQVSIGKIELDDSLIEYLKAQQRRLAAMKLEIDSIQCRQQIPLKKFGQTHVYAFTEAIRSELLNPKSIHTKQYLKALVREIRVSTGRIEFNGSNAGMIAVISKWKAGHSHLEVPSLVSNWRPRHESNV